MVPGAKAAADLDGFFAAYAAAYNRSLGVRVDVDGIRSFFSDEFIAAGPSGVKTGKNDGAFADSLEKGYAFYKKIGTKRLAVVRVAASTIDDAHALARVFYRADYQRADARAVSIDFDVTYLIDFTSGRPKIFGFIAGDEMAAFRNAGLVD